MSTCTTDVLYQHLVIFISEGNFLSRITSAGENIIGSLCVKDKMATVGPSSESGDKQEVANNSLPMAMFGQDLKRKEEHINEKVGSIIKTVVCRHAISLKVELLKEMNLEESQVKLKSCVEQLRVFQNLLTSINVKMTTLQRGSVMYESLENSKRTTMNSVRKCMAEMARIEENIDGLKASWEFFRSNYKDYALKGINTELKKREQEGRGKEAITWEQFLPTVKIERNDGKVTAATRINYFD